MIASLSAYNRPINILQRALKTKFHKIHPRFFNSRTSPADIAIIGAGAAGMSCAISARYEGFKISVFESRQTLGGSFSNTPLIHNLPGHPIGISGSSLSHASYQQALKLGADCNFGTSIVKISKDTKNFILYDQNNKYYLAHKIILATGVQYRRLNIEGSKTLENKGIYYEVEDALTEKIKQMPLIIYGAGNSAGQAVMFYQSNGAKISLIFRGDNLESSMSKYLIERIKRNRVRLIPNTVITSVEGLDWLSTIKIKNQKNGIEQYIKTKYLFTMIGGIPPKLPDLDFGKLKIDARGYVVINSKIDFSTSVDGIYAVGDITSIGAGRIILAQAQGVMAFTQAALSLDPNAAL